MLLLTKRLILAIETVADISDCMSVLTAHVQRQRISMRYLEWVVQRLVLSNILSGVRGLAVDTTYRNLALIVGRD
jgi:hypothetical protein